MFLKEEERTDQISMFFKQLTLSIKLQSRKQNLKSGNFKKNPLTARDT